MTDTEQPSVSATPLVVPGVVNNGETTGEEHLVQKNTDSELGGSSTVDGSSKSIGASKSDSNTSDVSAKPVSGGIELVPAQQQLVVDTSSNNGQQYYVVVTQDQNGKVVGAVQQGTSALPSGSLPASNLLKPATQVTVKRGAAKNAAKAAAAVTSAVVTGLVQARPATAQASSPRPLLSGIAAPQAGQAIRLIPFSSAGAGVAGSGQSLIFTSPAGSTSLISPATTAIRKPTPPLSPVASKPAVPAAATTTAAVVVPKTTPLLKPAAPMVTTSPVVSAVKKSVVKASPVSQVTSQKLMSATRVPVLPSTAAKGAKPLAAVDKTIQQKRILGESIIKLRKIEQVLVQAKPDQATAFTYGEMFHQAAVSFSKMAALTTHISLESQTPTEQRRWSPELINKFVTSINAFATSMKEVGDDLKKRHEQQLVANLKRKADTEVANAKKLAALGVAAVHHPTVPYQPPVAAVVNPPSQAVTSELTNGVGPAVSSDYIAQVPTSEAGSVSTSKHPLGMSTAEQALSTLMSAAKTNSVEASGPAHAKEDEPMEVSPEKTTIPSTTASVESEASVKNADDTETAAESHAPLTNGYSGSFASEML